MEWVDVPFEVQKPQSGQRVDAFLAKRLERYSRSQIQALIREGRVLLRGHAAKASSRINSGDLLLIRYPKHPQPPCAYEKLEVLYEDEYLLAVNKPEQMLSHPTDKIISNAVTTVLKNQFPNANLHLLHRLDRETSGVLLIAKDAQTASTFSHYFSSRRIQKEYLAITAGRAAFKTLRVDQAIEGEGQHIKVRQKIGGERSAVTDFKTLSLGPTASLIMAYPRTGRLHQIRVHLASLGHPLLGDKLYFGDGAAYLKAVDQSIDEQDLQSLRAKRQMLHAYRLTLPKEYNHRQITAAPPSDFMSCLRENNVHWNE